MGETKAKRTRGNESDRLSAKRRVLKEADVRKAKVEDVVNRRLVGAHGGAWARSVRGSIRVET
ncbi:MAG: hypothetical protein LBT00_04355 [Spirochaetaceae bacterium]|jgi:hypothetical protein|nr:hypothetical protein [Spirochaetaceae bacterium]